MTSPNPDECRRAMHLIDTAIVCVNDKPLTVNNMDDLKACRAWLFEMKASIAQQLQDAEGGFVKGCQHDWCYRGGNQELVCGICNTPRAQYMSGNAL